MLILRVGWFYFHRGQIVTPRAKSLIVKFQALIICKQCNTVPDFYILGLGTSLICTITFPIFISEENFLAFDFL